jgi:uncharacterized OsmC-like protein
VTEVDGVVLFCADRPAPLLLVGQDRALVLLEARGIPAGEGRLQAHTVGEIELDDKVLVVRRIHVTYRLAADQAQRATIERVLGVHAGRCPVARTIGGCVAISTSLDLQPVKAAS